MRGKVKKTQNANTTLLKFELEKRMRGEVKKTQNANTTPSNLLPKPISIPFKPSQSNSKPITNPNLNGVNLFYSPPYIHSEFTFRRHWYVLTTTVYSLSSSASATSWLYAAVNRGENPPQLLHPLTLKPHRFNRPINLHLFNSQIRSLTSFKHTDFRFDKLVIPQLESKTLDTNTIVVLFGGRRLVARLPLTATYNEVKWVALSEDKFDDIIISEGNAYVVDRSGNLYLIYILIPTEILWMCPWQMTLPVPPGYRKRLVLDSEKIYCVVRLEVEVFRVCKKIKVGSSWPNHCWEVINGFDDGKVLFVSKDCCFFIKGFGGREYKNCVVFTEGGFPKYEDDGWEYQGAGEDEIMVFRMSDGRYGKVGESVDFPEIDWSPPSWIFDMSEVEKDGGVQEGMEEQDKRHDSDIRDLEGGKMQCDSNSQEKMVEQMPSNANIEGDTSLQEDVPSSLVASISAIEEEVTRTLVCMNGENEPTEKELSRKNTIPSTPRACTSSAAKRYKSDAATTKFEGYDIRSDLVPTLQKIWRNHGNIIESSLMRSSSVIANALELLATVVQILENDTVESLSECQADYLSSTLSDLKIMSFNVEWLNSFVEKAIKLHKSEALVDSLNKLGQLCSQVKERKAIHANKLAELTEEENKLESEMARVSKLIPFSGEVKLDEPFGSGLT